KSRFIAEVLASPAQVLLFPRPRRFGKSLTLSAFGAFVDRERIDRSEAWFRDLAVAREAHAWQQRGRYPLIALTLKDVRPESMDVLVTMLADVIALELERHADLLDAPALSAGTRQRLEALRTGQATRLAVSGALATMTRALHEAHGER